MTTVAAIVRDALGHLRVLDANEAVEAEDARDAVRALNLMMRRWEASGLALGWNDVTSVADTLPAPPEAEEAIGYNLALKLRARYGATLDQDTVALANDGLAALRADVAMRDSARLSYDLPGAGCAGGLSDFLAGR
jgi:hypothetical protein